MPLLGTPENLLKITKTGSSGPHEAAIVLCKHAGIWATVCYRRIAVPAPPIDQLLDPGGPELCSIFTAGNDLLSIPITVRTLTAKKLVLFIRIEMIIIFFWQDQRQASVF